ncbi:MAG TPA: hypothetical protein VFF29_06230 [Bacteroidota bacterium]|nr:hypothetical protein [Bacteroidota bacterium]
MNIRDFQFEVHVRQRTLSTYILMWSLTIFPALFIGCSSTKPIVAVRPNEHMEIGWTPRSVLQTSTYPWFDSAYTLYEPQQEFIDKIHAIKDSLDLILIYGTWCSDSKREVPKFFKIVDTIGISSERISMFAVDRTKHYPPGIPQEYSIVLVPTIIVKYRGFEIGRIVEKPKSTIEEDLFEIILPLTEQ